MNWNKWDLLKPAVSANSFVAAVILASIQAAPISAQLSTFDIVSGGVLDQEFDDDSFSPGTVNFHAMSGYTQVAQSFVAGRDAYLSHIMMRVGAPNGTPVTASIFNFHNSLPDEVLASRTIIPGNRISKPWTTFDMRSQSLRLKAGEKYAIALEVPPTMGYANWASSLWGNPDADL